MKKGEKRKQELLKIAYQMFIAKGYDRTSIDEIIDAAGIAKGTYYYYFESKEQTLEAVIDFMIDEETARARAISEMEISVPEKIVGIISSLRPEQNEAPIGDALNRPENIIMHEKMNRKLIDRVVPLLTEVVTQGIQEGIFACSNVPERVKQILYLSRALFDDDHYTEADIDVFIDTAERILYAKPGSMGFIRQLIDGSKNAEKGEDNDGKK